MPAEPAQSMQAMNHDGLARAFHEIMGELNQYLEDQRAMGITHARISEQTLKIISTWGTREWKQHRFTCQGPSDASIMIVDSKGGFYQDKAGRLLVKILKAMHLTPDQVYICNAADEQEIRSRVTRGRPRVIIALGQEACYCLLGNGQQFEQRRGRFHNFCGAKVMPTRHPAELLDDAGLKRGVWEDMQKVMAEAGLDHGG